jgi:hypothetical protein
VDLAHGLVDEADLLRAAAEAQARRRASGTCSVTSALLPPMRTPTTPRGAGSLRRSRSTPPASWNVRS